MDDGVMNGLVLAGQYLPKELLSRILSETDVDTLFACRNVCVQWREIVDNMVWKEKIWRDRRRNKRLSSLAQFNKGDIIKPANFPPHLLYTIFKSDPFNRNHIRNSSGSEGDAYWRIQSPLAWNTEQLDGEHCFRTNPDIRGCFVKSQVIELAEIGLDAFTMDFMRPQFVVSDEYSAKGENAYCLQAILHNEDHEHVSSKIVLRLTKEPDFRKVEFAFYGYGAGIRYISIWHACQGLNIRVRNTTLKVNLKPYRVDPSPGTLDGYLSHDHCLLHNPSDAPHFMLYLTPHNNLVLTQDSEHPFALQWSTLMQILVHERRTLYRTERNIPLPYPDGSWGPNVE